MQEYTKLIDSARNALKNAHAPYSRFRVGAAILASSGKIYAGCNIETSSYGLTICAERVAVFKAVSEGDAVFTAIAIATITEKPCPPCGACRQVLWDICRDIDVVMVAKNGDISTAKLSSLFPMAFDEDFLAK